MSSAPPSSSPWHYEVEAVENQERENQSLEADSADSLSALRTRVAKLQTEIALNSALAAAADAKQAVSAAGEATPPRRRRGQRGPGRPMLERLAEKLDRQLLELLTHGVLLYDHRTGKPRFGADGQPIYAPPSAAHYRVIQARLKDCRVGEAPRSRFTGRLLEEASDRGILRVSGAAARRKFPPLDLENDDDATRGCY